MKTWQAILVHMLLAIGAAVVPTIKDPVLQVAIGAAVASGTVAAAQVNSESNPDGSSSRGSYTPEGK